MEVPTLALTGDRLDVLVTDAIRRRAEALHNPNLAIAVVPGAAHCVRREQPDAYHAIVDRFLVTSPSVT